MKAVDAAGGPENKDALDVPLPAINSDLVTETERALMVSYLLGMYHAAAPGKIALADAEQTVAAIPFDEAVKYMKTRIPMTKKEWSALEPELRFRAFTVAALSTPDAIDKAKGMIQSAVEEGKGKAEFWKETRAFEAAGLTHAAPLYWENVYRTNIQTAYNTGRVAEYMRDNPEYLEFMGIDDGRQSDICYALTHPVIILPATHPFWSTHIPPLHYRCRSTTRGMYREEVDALREANPQWGPSDIEAEKLPETASGFGGNPLDSGSFWKMTPSMKARAEEYGLLDQIEAYAQSLGLPLKEIVLEAAKPEVVKEAVAGVPLFKTIKQAETWVKANLADNCSFKGSSIDLVQDVVRRLKENVDSYPEAREKLEFVGTIQERNKVVKKNIYDYYLEQFRKSGAQEDQAKHWAEKYTAEYMKKYRVKPGVIAEYMHSEKGLGTMGISINDKLPGSDALTKAVESDVASGWFPQMPAKATTIVDHEFGHLLDHVYGLSESQELLSYRNGLSSIDVADGLSRYGTKNVKEFIAESWSEYMNSEKPRTIAKTVGDMMMKRRTVK
jgi:hypothetical protein